MPTNLHRMKESRKSTTPEHRVDFQALLCPERWKEGLSVEHSIICYQSSPETLTSNVDRKYFKLGVSISVGKHEFCTLLHTTRKVNHQLAKATGNKRQAETGKLRLSTTLFLHSDGSVLQVTAQPPHLTAGINSDLGTVVLLPLLCPRSTQNRLTSAALPVKAVSIYVNLRTQEPEQTHVPSPSNTSPGCRFSRCTEVSDRPLFLLVP